MQILNNVTELNMVNKDLFSNESNQFKQYIKSTFLFSNKTTQLVTFSNHTDLVIPKKISIQSNFLYLTRTQKYFHEDIYALTVSKHLYRKYWSFLLEFANKRKIPVNHISRLIKVLRVKRFKRIFKGLVAINGRILPKTKYQIFKKSKKIKNFKKWQRIIKCLNKRKLNFSIKNSNI